MRTPSLPLQHLRLRHQVLWLLTGITALSMVLLYQVSTHRLSAVAGNSAAHWAQAVAQTAATAAAVPMEAGDRAAAQATLRHFATLPGVERLDALDAFGQPLLRLAVTPDRRVQEPAEADDRGADSAWAPVGPGGRGGSIGVRFSSGAAQLELDQLRYDAVLAIAAVGLLSIVAASLLLSWALAPLQRVARFSRSLVTQAGQQLDERTGSREVADLADALNDASRTLQAQLEAIRASELRTRGIVNAVPDAIIGVDAGGLVRSASPAVASVFGREAAQLCGLPLAALMPGLDAPEAERRTLAGLYMRASQTHVARFEVQALRQDGTPFPAEVSLARVDAHDDEGADGDTGAMRYACAVRDVTDQRMLDAMLNLYVRALECSSNGVLISDHGLPGRPIIYANAAFRRITGYEPHQAIGRNCEFLHGADAAQPELAALQQAMAQGRSATAVVRHYRADGSLFFDEVSVAPVHDELGAARHYVCILNDVTERERTQLAIAERNARLNAVFDLSPDGFVVFDREDQLVYANPAFLAMTGWSGGDLSAGLTLAEFDDRMAGLCAPDAPCPPTQRAPDSAPEMALLQLRHPRPRTLTRLARHNAGGQGESILYFRDVTHETEVDRMKSEFLTTAAHELRTPMVSVFGFTELLLQRPVPEGRRRDVLETIHRQASLLISMINDLLDLARIESRQGRDLHRERVPVAALVADTVARLAGAADGHELRVTLAPGHQDLALWADPVKTSQALTNVLSNAIKYSRPGSIVRVSSLRSSTRLGLLVRDQGIGMTPPQLARVFERFYRADPSGNIPGTGLGMSLVKEIAEQQDGHVEVHSEAGMGTEVTLWLPLARRDGDGPLPAAGAESPRAQLPEPP